MKIILPAYHTAARRCIRAFPTSPTVATLTETGLPSIKERTTLTLFKLTIKLLQCKNTVLQNAVNAFIRRKTPLARPSAVARCINAAKDLGIPIKLVKFDYKRPEPWFKPHNHLIVDMQSNKKSTTTPVAYQQTFKQICANLKDQGYTFLYTDGTKTSNTTAFAVIDSNDETVSVGHMLTFCSVYTAEAYAVLQAAQYALHSGVKHVICTDSLSTIQSISNTSNKNCLSSSIRNTLALGNNSIKIMWVPSHVGIPGNEAADERAKLAVNQPLITIPVMLKEDVYRLSKTHISKTKLEEWRNIHNHYSAINVRGQKPIFPRSANSKVITHFCRLRIGHTISTHSHILKGSGTPQCNFCNAAAVSVTHLLDDCQHFASIRANIFGRNIPSETLKSYDIESIKNINKYLSLAELKKLI